MKCQKADLIGGLWKQLVRWRLLLAVFSIALLGAQILFWFFRMSITPFDREAWLNNRNRGVYVTDLLWNRIKKGDAQTKVTALLGEPDSNYWEGGPGEAIYYLPGPNPELIGGIFYIRYSDGRMDEIRATYL